MAKRQTQGAQEDTREKLMRLAARSFGTQGYAATTMRHIADQAGIEAASIYYHFSSKEALVDAVMAHGADNIVRHTHERLAALPKDADAQLCFKVAMAGQLDAVIKYGDYAFARGRLHAQLPEKVQARQVARSEQYKAFWDELFTRLQQEGFLRDNVNVGLCRVLVLSTINSAVSWFDPQKGSPELVVEQLCAMLFNGITPRER